MLKRMNKIAAAAVTLALFTNIANGAGFALYEFSARGNAMGGAVMANKAEPASIATNPALINELDGLQVQAGATLVQANATATVDGVSRDMADKTHTLPNAYITYKTSEAVSLGLGVFSRFGLGGKYENSDNWVGSSSASEFDLVTISVTPVISGKVTHDITVSAGMEFMDVQFSESKKITAMNLPFKVEGDGMSWGGVLAAAYKPHWNEKLGFGLAYRTKTRQVLDGTLEAHPGLGLPTGDVRGSVTLPDSINFGVSYQFTPKFLMEAGIVGTFWSSYDAIKIEVPTTAVPGAQGIMLVEQKNYKDAVRVNLGAEYALTDNWLVRGGYVYDQNPSNGSYMDTLVPVADRHLFNAGLGYQTEVWGVDVAYTYLLGKDMSGKGKTKSPLGADQVSDFKYTNGDSHMLGVTFKYMFDVEMLRK